MRSGPDWLQQQVSHHGSFHKAQRASLPAARLISLCKVCTPSPQPPNVSRQCFRRRGMWPQGSVGGGHVTRAGQLGVVPRTLL